MKSPDTAISNEQELTSIVDKLEKLLLQQLEFARKGNMAKVEALAGEAHILVEQMSDTKFVTGAGFEERRKELQGLYGEICLVLSAQMDDVSQSLGRVYKGKKTVMLYRDSI